MVSAAAAAVALFSICMQLAHEPTGYLCVRLGLRTITINFASFAYAHSAAAAIAAAVDDDDHHHHNDEAGCLATNACCSTAFYTTR